MLNTPRSQYTSLIQLSEFANKKIGLYTLRESIEFMLQKKQ